MDGRSFFSSFWNFHAFEIRFDIAEPNYVIGMAHGVLFILYNILVLKHSKLKNWKIKDYFSVHFITFSVWHFFWSGLRDHCLIIQNKVQDGIHSSSFDMNDFEIRIDLLL